MNVASGASFTFAPSAATNYLLSARARFPGRVLSWGPATQISATLPAPTLQLVTKPVVSGGQVQVEFAVSNYRAGATFTLWKASTPEGNWTQDTTATLQTIVPNAQFRLTTATGGAARAFFKVRASY